MSDYRYGWSMPKLKALRGTSLSAHAARRRAEAEKDASRQLGITIEMVRLGSWRYGPLSETEDGKSFIVSWTWSPPRLREALDE